jgi:DNA primase
MFVSKVLEEFLGPTKKSNIETGQLAYNCPLCDENGNKGNLEVNYIKNKFKCWSCGELNHMSGNVFTLIKRFGTPRQLKTYKLLLPPEYHEQRKIEKEIIRELPKEFIPLTNISPYHYKAQIALNYLKERNIGEELIKKFNIGYAISGKYYNRIIIPSYDSNGDINYFVSRWFEKEKTKIKHLNPDANKESIIFNEKLINWDSTIYLVEGGFDHLIIPNSIPLLGKVLFTYLFESLYTKANANIVILLDGEDEAIADAKALYVKLNVGDLKDRIRICIPPKDFDASKIHQVLGVKGIFELLIGAKKLTDKELYKIHLNKS